MVAPNGHPDSHDELAGANGAARSSSETNPAIVKMVARILPGLDRLLRAYECAQDVGCDLWDFALEVRELRAAELTNSDLRWLVCKGYAEHAREVTLPGEDCRSFRRVKGLTFTKRTCFVLTKRGVSFLRQLRETAGAVTQKRREEVASRVMAKVPDAVPHWDSDLQELRVNGEVVKQFKVPAPNQEIILAAFEEEGWPPRIDDPLPPNAEQDPKRRLHDTINSLNRNHKVELIRFLGDGSGQGIRWSLISGGNGESQ
jgi:hypothetical protein